MDSEKLAGLTLTEWKAGIVLQRSTHLRRQSQEIADSLLANLCGMSQRSAASAKSSLAQRGLVSTGLAPWQGKGGCITSYSELGEPTRGVLYPFEFVDRLLPLIRAQAERRVAEAMLRAMDGGRLATGPVRDVFTAAELLTLTGLPESRLYPALRSEIFQRVGYGRYKLALEDWRPISRPARPRLKAFAYIRVLSCSPVRSVGRKSLPAVSFPPSRAYAVEPALPPQKIQQALREYNPPECAPAPQDGCDSLPQGSCAQTAGQAHQAAQGPEIRATRAATRLPFSRGWVKPGRTALDLFALHAAMTRQAADPRMSRYAKFWMLRAGGYAKVAALIVYAVENWQAVQESLDLFDQEPTLDVVYNYRAAIARLMAPPEHDEPAQETEPEREYREMLADLWNELQHRQQTERAKCRERETSAQASKQRDEIRSKIERYQRQLDQARRDVARFSHSPRSVPSNLARRKEREAQRAIEALTEEMESR